MIKTIGMYCSFLTLLFIGSLGSVARAQGLLPVPDVTGAAVSADVSLIQGLPFGGEYEYRYTVTSPATATGNIWLFEVDVSSKERTRPIGSGLLVRAYPVQGGAATASMEEDADLLAPFFGEKGREVVVVNQLAPAGWNGGLTRHAFVQFAVGDSAFTIPPGTSVSGMNIQVSRPPTIRKYSLTPDWVLLVDDHDLVTDQEIEDGAITTQSLPVTGFTLGPLDSAPGGFPHYKRFSTDMRSAEFMGWVSDAALVNSLETNLGIARDEVFIGNNGLALAALQEMLDSIAAADASTFNTEFRLLVELNVPSLVSAIPTFNNTFIPVFEATPDSADLIRGEAFSLTMRNFNSALEGNPPIENLRVLVRCAQGFTCANADQLVPGTAFRIDMTGQVVFSYSGQKAGFDLIEVVENDFEVFRQLALVEVNWRAETDLVVPAFVPPIIGAVSGDTIFITDRTKNKGTVAVTVPTITRYYISTIEPVDIATPVIDIASATIVGERSVPPLGVDEFSDSVELAFVVPPGFNGDVHYLAACADAENISVESLEDNNCSFSEFEIEVVTAAMLVDPGSNIAPVATGASVVTDQDTAIGIALTGQDDNGDVLIFSVQTSPGNGTLSGTAPDLIYTPNSGFAGSDSFTFIVNDGLVDSNVATVSIVVDVVNAVPIAVGQSVTTDKEVAVAITLSGQDGDGDTLAFSVLVGPVNGMLTGMAPNLTYAPIAGFTGLDSFTFVVNDGTVDSSAASVSITVNATGDDCDEDDDSDSDGGTDSDSDNGVCEEEDDSDSDSDSDNADDESDSESNPDTEFQTSS